MDESEKAKVTKKDSKTRFEKLIDAFRSFFYGASIKDKKREKEEEIYTNHEKGFEKLRDAFRGILYGVSIKGKIGIPGLSGAELSVSPKDMIDRYEKLRQPATDWFLDQSLYFRSFSRLDEIAKDETPKLIIFIDDLDRCFPDKAVALLEGIKLVLNQQNITFILGVSPTIIGAYLSAKYRKEYDIEAELYEHYLDKLVQLPFQIPNIEEKVEDYARSLLKRKDVFGSIDEDQFEREYEPLVSICGPACADNPRAIIRFLNRLLILTRAHEQKGSQTEISLVHFGITNALQMNKNWKRIYMACEHDRRINHQAPLEGEANLCKALEVIFNQFKSDTDLIDCLEKYAKDDNNPEKYIFQVLSTDASLRKLLKSEPGIEWLSKPTLRKEAAATTEQVKTTDTTRSDLIRISYPWAESYTEDGWPIIKKYIIKPKADLEGANLFGATLNEANLEGADLDGANLNGANLIGANLKGAVLSEANLEEALMEGANLSEANLDGSNLNNTRLNLANLEGADLDGADLDGANLKWTNLKGSNLKGVVLYEANLEDALMEGANLEEAHLNGANLQRANLNRAILNKARYDNMTKWPKGYDPESHGAIKERE